MPLPIIVTQIWKEWMLEDEFNHAIKDKISIQSENISSSYNASANRLGTFHATRTCPRCIIII